MLATFVIGLVGALVVVGLVAGWPPGRAPVARTLAHALLACGAGLALLGGILAVLTPPRPAPPVPSETLQDGPRGRSVATLDGVLVVRPGGTGTTRGLHTVVYRGAATVADAGAERIGVGRAAALGGGRLPVGFVTGGASSVTVRYRDRIAATVWVEPRTGRILDLHSSYRTFALALDATGRSWPLRVPAAADATRLTPSDVAGRVASARADLRRLDRAALLDGLTYTALGAALVLLAGGAGVRAVDRRRRRNRSEARPAAAPLVG